MSATLTEAVAAPLTLTRGPDDLSPWSRALRESVRVESTYYTERVLLVADSFRATEGEPYHEVRWAKATAHLLSNCPVRIRVGERLVGWHPNSNPDETTREAIQEAHRYLAGEGYWAAASEGHMALDYPTILSSGLGAILAEIRDRRAALDPCDPATPDKAVFYETAEISLLALQGFIGRYATLASELAGSEPDPAWRRELAEIARVCTRIAHEPAATFREALQLMWFCFLGVALEASGSHHCFGPGRLDQYMIPYLEADREAGRLDDELLDDLLDQLFIKCNEFAGDEMSALIMGVAGRKPDGSDATNEISRRLLRSSDRTRMYMPGLDIFWHKDIPTDFMRDACILLRNGNGQPSFFNDAVIIRGLERYGVPFEHAVDHLPSTCTETSIMGRTNPWVAWPYMNLAQALLTALGDTGSPPDSLPQTWDSLLEAVLGQIGTTARQAVAQGIRDQSVAARARPFPLLSCFIRGCLESGRNISHGGAMYNFLQPEAVGVANVVDSLAAIKTLVFDEQRYSLDDFRRATAANWDGYEELRRAVERDCPKYGNDDPWVNDLFALVAGRWCEAIEGCRNYYGGPVFPGFLGWVVWIGFGEATPATPDGRRAGEPLANSLAPRSGVALKGTASAILSASGFDHSRGLGGITFNLRFNQNSLADDGGPDRLRAMIEAALGSAGLYMVQIDVASTSVLRAAQANPANHRDLLVRIGGYLVPFVLLPRNAQDEVIERAELDL